MIIEKEIISDFCYLGKRKYVHSHQLLSFVLDKIRECYKVEDELFVKHFKVYDEVSTNIYLINDKKSDLKPLVELKYIVNDSYNIIYMMPYNIGINKRLEDKKMPVKVDSCNGDFSGTGVIKKVINYIEFFNSIVELNKQIHLLSLGDLDYDPKIRAVYFNNFKAYKSFRSELSEVSIKCKSRKTFRGNEYSVSSVTWVNEKIECNMEVCFSFI